MGSIFAPFTPVFHHFPSPLASTAQVCRPRLRLPLLFYYYDVSLSLSLFFLLTLPFRMNVDKKNIRKRNETHTQNTRNEKKKMMKKKCFEKWFNCRHTHTHTHMKQNTDESNNKNTRNLWVAIWPASALIYGRHLCFLCCFPKKKMSVKKSSRKKNLCNSLAGRTNPSRISQESPKNPQRIFPKGEVRPRMPRIPVGPKESLQNP